MKILLLIVLCIYFTHSQTQLQYSYDDQAAWTHLGTCGGSSQSPVDFLCPQIAVKCPPRKSYDIFWKDPIMNYVATDSKDLQRSYNNENSWLRFSNETNDYVYKADHLKWHRPSEHSVHGKFYDLQLHLIHKLDSTKHQQYAAVGVLFQVDDSLEYDIFDSIELHSQSFTDKMPFPFPLTNKPAYYYRGSNTVPPCQQSVNVFIQLQPHKITRRNLNKFISGIHGGKPNNRLQHRLGNRNVYLIGNQCSASSSSSSMAM